MLLSSMILISLDIVEHVPASLSCIMIVRIGIVLVTLYFSQSYKIDIDKVRAEKWLPQALLRKYSLVGACQDHCFKD